MNASLPSAIRLRWLRHDGRVDVVDDHRGVGRKQGEGILWIDLSPTPDTERVADLFDEMQLPGYERPMLGHVIQGTGPDDYGAESVPWYDADVAARLAAPSGVAFLKAFDLMAETAVAPVGDEEPPKLFLREVLFLVSDRWIVTARKRGFAVTRGIAFNRDPVPFEYLLRFTRERWGSFNEPHDAATLMLRAIVDTFLTALEAISRRLQNSELGYVRGLDEADGAGNLDERAYRVELVDIKWMVDGVSGALNRLARPGTDTSVAWFRVHSGAAKQLAVEVRELVDLARGEVARQREQLRESFDLVASTQASRQLELARQEQSRGQRLERAITLVTAILLVPGLVAAFFGAMPSILADCWWGRTLLILGTMLGFGVASYITLRSLRSGEA